MSDELEPLSTFAEKTLAAERRRPDVESDVADRLLARVGATIAATAVLAGVAGAAGGSGVAAASGANAGKAAAIGLTAKAAPWIVLAFVAGGAAGAGVHAAATPAKPATVSVVPPATSVAAARPLAASDAPPTNDAVPVTSLPDKATLTPGPMPARPTPSSAEPDVALTSERALVERARTALGRGQLDAALEAVEAHASRFPRGRLEEEREAIAIQALAKLGRPDEAQGRAKAFRKAHPNSVFLPAVDLAAPAP